MNSLYNSCSHIPVLCAFCLSFCPLFQPDFVSCMFDLAQSLNQLNLNDTEIGLFCAIVLATPGLSYKQLELFMSV